MPNLRRLSGSDVLKILQQSGFEIILQRGSHVKLRRLTTTGEKQTLTVPNHDELDTGTCRAIYRQAARYIPADDLQLYFYS